jgi:hypothetical protein
MTQRDLSPEEKLLRLIKGENKKKSSQESRQDSSAEDLRPVYLKKDGSLPSIKTKTHLHMPFLKLVHHFLWVVFLISSLYLLKDFLIPEEKLEKIPLPEKIAEPKIEEPQVVVDKTKLEPYSYYSSQITKRDLFSSTVTKTQTPASSKNILSQAIQDLNLIGVISGENPQAIIEDKKNQKTHFLSKGDFIGDFQVQDIQKGKVILDYKGEKFELSL